MSDAFTYNRAILADIEHLAAHLESGDDFSDHCDRVLISDGCFGLDWQIQRGLDWLIGHDLMDAAEAQDALDYQNSPDYCGDLPDEIESLSGGLLFWEDGDLFERPEECALWAEFERGEWALSVETQGEHVEICLACGGPGTYLRRDFDGDRLVTFWGSDRAEARGDALGTVLDYFAEMAG